MKPPIDGPGPPGTPSPSPSPLPLPLPSSGNGAAPAAKAPPQRAGTARRRWVIGGVAMAAAAAGMAWSWWRLQSLHASPPTPRIDPWGLRFERPEGGELVLADLKGQPLLLNFWATWCPPCITEMPLLDRFQAQQRGNGWQVVGLAVDSPTPVRQFLAQRPVGFAIGLAGLTGIDLGRALGNASGALPFSVVFDRQGRIVHTKLGLLHATDLDKWVGALG